MPCRYAGVGRRTCGGFGSNCPIGRPRAAYFASCRADGGFYRVLSPLAALLFRRHQVNVNPIAQGGSSTAERIGPEPGICLIRHAIQLRLTDGPACAICESPTATTTPRLAAMTRAPLGPSTPQRLLSEGNLSR